MSSVIGNRTKARIMCTTHVSQWGACIHNTHLFSDTTTILAVELTFCQSYHMYIYICIFVHIYKATQEIYTQCFSTTFWPANMLSAICLLSGLAHHTVECFYPGRWIMLDKITFVGRMGGNIHMSKYSRVISCYVFWVIKSLNIAKSINMLKYIGVFVADWNRYSSSK